MGIVINNETIRNMSTRSIVGITLVGYVVGIGLYYNLRQKPIVSKILVVDVKWLGTITRAQHMALFMMLGYFLPDRFLLVMLLGAGWEVAEFIARSQFRDKWWGDGSDYLKDLIANATGFLVGAILHARRN